MVNRFSSAAVSVVVAVAVMAVVVVAHGASRQVQCVAALWERTAVHIEVEERRRYYHLVVVVLVPPYLLSM